MPLHALTMLLAGFGIPVLAALNARLGGHIGSPAAAAVIPEVAPGAVDLVPGTKQGSAP